MLKILLNRLFSTMIKNIDKSKKIELKIIKGLNINVEGKYLAVLLIDTSP